MLRDSDEKGRDILQKEMDKYTGERKVIDPRGLMLILKECLINKF